MSTVEQASNQADFPIYSEKLTHGIHEFIERKIFLKRWRRSILINKAMFPE